MIDFSQGLKKCFFHKSTIRKRLFKVFRLNKYKEKNAHSSKYFR